MYIPQLYQLYDLYTAGHPITTDSRKIQPGALFFALKGDNFDGNAYATGALESGAACVVVDDPAVVRDERYILVRNVLETLQALARHHRRQLAIPVLAITGSNGKTTTKELVSRVLSRRFRVSTTQGNLNNHIGVPLTLLAIPPDTEFAVVEMGANHRGEIASYCAIAEPDYGLITNIGKAHLEGFGGEAGIRQGKGELFDYLARTDGTAFYPSESELLTEMAAERPSLMAYGFSTGALQAVPSDDSLLALRYGEQTIRTHLVGEYNSYNVAAALAIGEFFEVDTPDMIQAVESYVPDNNRSQRVVTERNILYMDAYNANPLSVKVALDSFAKASEEGHEKMLILGDMLELGEYSHLEHRSVVELIADLGFREVCLVGPAFGKADAENRYRAFPDAGALSVWLQQNPPSGRVILIKGSRGMRLEEVVTLL